MFGLTPPEMMSISHSVISLRSLNFSPARAGVRNEVSSEVTIAGHAIAIDSLSRFHTCVC